ncbi:MAG: exodeoxyribonuclease III, partial [Flavobacteriales bacterium]
HHYISELIQQVPNLIIAGDYNICHKAIDIHNPQRNQKTSGFLPEEREWLSTFIDLGFIDTFRHFNQEPHQYSWWSYRGGAREKNVGWRLDYMLVSNRLMSDVKHVHIHNEIHGSDHCPVSIELQL